MSNYKLIANCFFSRTNKYRIWRGTLEFFWSQSWVGLFHWGSTKHLRRKPLFITPSLRVYRHGRWHYMARRHRETFPILKRPPPHRFMQLFISSRSSRKKALFMMTSSNFSILAIPHNVNIFHLIRQWVPVWLSLPTDILWRTIIWFRMQLVSRSHWTINGCTRPEL